MKSCCTIRVGAILGWKLRVGKGSDIHCCIVLSRGRYRGRNRFLLRQGMALSARNQLQGRVEEVRLGTVMAHVVVKVGDNLIESVITRISAEELALKRGDVVRVVIKSTEVMI